MAERKQVFRYALVNGEPVSAGGVRITPRARVVEVHWPRGGLVWNRPDSVTVERDGQLTQVPIVDVTWAALLALGVLAALASGVVAAQMSRGMGRHHE